MKRFGKFILACICSAVLLCCSGLHTMAKVSLPDGAIEGLPEGLTAVDDDGNVVDSDSGRYFFIVEGMQYGVTYTKRIEIMNLRDDKAYHIYFYAEPISQEGDINLQEWCSCVITFEGEEVYNGKITGDGNINLTEEPLDLGLYEPGQSRAMRVDVTWDGGNYGGLVDNGSRLVDIDGVHILEGPGGQNYVYGITEFRWIFYAVVDEDYVPPKTGILSGNSMWYILLLVIAAGCVVSAFAVLKKKKKD